MSVATGRKKGISLGPRSLWGRDGKERTGVRRGHAALHDVPAWELSIAARSRSCETPSVCLYCCVFTFCSASPNPMLTAAGGAGPGAQRDRPQGRQGADRAALALIQRSAALGAGQARMVPQRRTAPTVATVST